jgi:hypothetical protein
MRWITRFEMRSALFWDITRRRVVIVYWRFGTSYRSHLHGSRVRVGKKKKISYGIRCDVLHRLFQGILYFQNILVLHNTRLNVILFTPVRRLWPSIHRFSRNSEMFCVQISYIKFQSVRKVKVERRNRASFTLLKINMAFSAPIFTKLTITE